MDTPARPAAGFRQPSGRGDRAGRASAPLHPLRGLAECITKGNAPGRARLRDPVGPPPARRAARLLDWRVRVALNAQLLSFAHSYRGGGISRVIYHQLRVLRSLESQFRFVAFVPDL